MDLPFIINHGNINSTAIGQLLQRSKVKLISYPDLTLSWPWENLVQDCGKKGFDMKRQQFFHLHVRTGNTLKIPFRALRVLKIEDRSDNMLKIQDLPVARL